MYKKFFSDYGGATTPGLLRLSIYITSLDIDCPFLGPL